MIAPIPPPPRTRVVPPRIAWLLAVEFVILALLLVVVLDIHTHLALDLMGGLNPRGYRGPIARAKRPREARVALVGGTRAFGFGMVASAATAPAMFSRMMLVIDRPRTDPPPLTILNLGRVGHVAADYPRTIERYAYLRPDYICLYDELGVRDVEASSNDSGVFALTGYMPILPLALREKGFLLRFGSVPRGYAAEPVSVVGSPIRRAAGLMLETAGTALLSVDGWLGRRVSPRDAHAASVPYADQLQMAIDVAHQHARGVVVAVAPAELDVQRQNLRALDVVKQRCAASGWCRFVDLDSLPQARDKTLRVDAWNYGGEATWAVADAIGSAVLTLMGYH